MLCTLWIKNCLKDQILPTKLFYSAAGDPLDNRYIDLEISKAFPEAGEGSFAKMTVTKNTIYSLYGGRVYSQQEFVPYMQKSHEDFSKRKIKTSDQEYEDFWMYRC